jgi:hypothetical protein
MIIKHKNSKKNSKFLLSIFLLFILLITFVYFIVSRTKDLDYSILLNSLIEINDLDDIYLNIDFKGLQKIEEKRKEAISKNRLVASDSDFVNASISFDHISYKCKVRLKGDLSDHWVGDKFSLRVEIKNGNLVKGMSIFSLQDPSTRGEEAEMLFLNHLKMNDCVAVNYDFVNLIINGKNMGIYAMEEHFSKEFIESNKRRVGAVATFEDTLLWHQSKASNINFNSTFRSLPVKTRKSKSLDRNNPLIRQHNTAINLTRAIQENSLPASFVFDAEYMARFLSLVRLWSAEHCMGLDDINFLFNPVTCKLEPIGFDGLAGQHSETTFCYFTGGDRKDNWVNYALSDQLIARAYIRYLSQISRVDIKSLFDKEIIEKTEKVRNLRIREIALNYPGVFINNFQRILSRDHWRNISKIQSQIIKELDSELLLTVQAFPDEKSNNLEVVVKNCTTIPIEVRNFEIAGKSFNALEYYTNMSNIYEVNESSDRLLLLNYQGFGHTQSKKDHRFRIPYKSFDSIDDINDIIVYCRFSGLNDFCEVHSMIDTSSFDLNVLPNISSIIPSSFIEKENQIIAPSGDYEIKEKLLIPSSKTFIVEGGVNLRFEHNASMVCFGNVIMKGTPQKQINLTSISKNWPGIVLYENSDGSRFEYVNFANISGIGEDSNPNGMISNGWSLTGGISAYKTKLFINHCNFKDFLTEDALNIINAGFSLSDSNFSNIYSDAFDGDFVKGNIRNCSFSNIMGDAVDFSGSFGTVENCTFKNISDKAISVGEESNISVSESYINDVEFGIVSKDSSYTKVSSCVISDARSAAFSAFQKKKAFGPAEIIITDSNTSNSEKICLVQESNICVIDGIKKIGSFLNVADLYKKN